VGGGPRTRFILVLQFTLLLAILLVPLNKLAVVKIHLTHTQQVTHTDVKQATDSTPPEFLVSFLCVSVS